MSDLDNLLVESFDAEELIRFLDRCYGQDLLTELPAGPHGIRGLAFHTVRLLARRGLVNAQLLDALARTRPHRREAVRALARRLSLPEPEEPEAKTVVWNATASPEVDARLELVESLEAHLLERERHARDQERKEVLTRTIEELVQRLRATPSPRSGLVVAGARLEHVIGAGNFGTVWRARDLTSRQLVAAKLFNLDRLEDGIMLWRFRRSIRAMGALCKRRGAPPSIQQILQVSRDTLAFTSPYLGEGTLEGIERRGWTLGRKLSVFGGVCRAVAFAHGLGIIHRDIKPANVLLDQGLNPVLIDYDIADIRFVTQLSIAKGGLGTPIFAAPEQLESGENSDERSDVYSLGRLLYYLLLERSPGFQIERDPNVDNLPPSVPAGLRMIVRRATQWDPRRRYPSVAELVADIRRCHTGLAAVRAHAKSAVRWVRRHMALVSTASVISGSSFALAVSQNELAEQRRRLLDEMQRKLVDGKRELALLEDGVHRFEAVRDEIKTISADLTAIENEVDRPNCEVRAENVKKVAARMRAAAAKLEDSKSELVTSVDGIKLRQGELLDQLKGYAPPTEAPTRDAPPPPSQSPTSQASARPQVPPPPPDHLKQQILATTSHDGIPAVAQASEKTSAVDVAPAARQIKRKPKQRRSSRAATAPPPDYYGEIRRAAGAGLSECTDKDHYLRDTGSIKLDLRISKDGEVSLADLLPYHSDTVATCVRRVLRSIQLTASEKGARIAYKID